MQTQPPPTLDPNQLVTVRLPATSWNENLKILNKIAMRARQKFETVMPIIAQITAQGNAQSSVQAPEPPPPPVKDGHRHIVDQESETRVRRSNA